MNKKTDNVDKQYQDLLQDILDNGNVKNTRAGKTKSIFGTQMKIDLKQGFPLLTTKKMFTKGIIHELLWFLSGDTNIKYLVDNGVHIWDDDAYRWYCKLSNSVEWNLITIPSGDTLERLNGHIPMCKEEFLFYVNKSRKSRAPDGWDKNKCEVDYTFGDLGDIYSKQWRKFGISGTDQIQNIIDTLKTNPDDRRMLCIAYNPDVLDKVALPPCHVLSQFYTRELTINERWELYYNKFKDEEMDNDNFVRPHLEIYGNSGTFQYNGEHDYLLDEEDIPQRELSCSWYQRSVDVPLGLGFNIASYALLNHMIAHVCNMTVGDLIFNGGDTHIYINQICGIEEQLKRDPNKYKLPNLWLNPKVRNINDFTFDDIKIIDYASYEVIKMPLSTGF